jgi:Large ribosomal RNA subunit accumulation protein YceD
MSKTDSFWSVPVAVEDIPDTGLHIEIEAAAAARAAVAEFASLRELPQLSALFDLTRVGAGVHVGGQVQARIGQTCVVSLEPIENELAEAVDLRFMPMSAGSAAPPAKDREKPQGSDEPPEPLIDGQVDLGALAVEFLILGIDPYARKAGAQFVPPKVEDVSEHPFGALEILKKRLGGDQS